MPCSKELLHRGVNETELLFMFKFASFASRVSGEEERYLLFAYFVSSKFSKRHQVPFGLTKIYKITVKVFYVKRTKALRDKPFTREDFESDHFDLQWH